MKDLAVDVGCGSGQSTVVLQPFFKKVFGLDVSSNQIKAARKLCVPGCEFRIGSAEDLSEFPDSSVDLVTCCQAAHWLDLEAFYSEADRVLKPQEGLLAIYGYHLTGLRPEGQPKFAQIEALRDKVD